MIMDLCISRETAKKFPNEMMKKCEQKVERKKGQTKQEKKASQVCDGQRT